MQLIIISGPSGSGKTSLSKIILRDIKDGIVLNTDNYYKTGIISQILSKTVSCYFDRIMSFNNILFKKDLEFILKNRFSNYSYEYNFKSRTVKKNYKKIQNIRFVIVEGIFGQEIKKSLQGDSCILINLETDKKACMNRVIKRDYEERGKNKKLAKRDFIKAWEIYYKNKKRNNTTNFLKTIIVKNKSDINSLLKNLVNILN